MYSIRFVLGLITATGIGVLYFRDLGDVTQMLLKVKRENMLRFIRNEYRLLAIAGGGLLLMTLAYWGLGAGPRWLWWLAMLLNAVLLGFPWVWVHVGPRNQKDRAKYFPVENAWKWISPSTQVVVMENAGVARAHPDAQIMRQQRGPRRGRCDHDLLRRSQSRPWLQAAGGG